ncbi:phosphoglycerate dehydrogenase [Treponema lecithinolyticum]|jgi:Phosphoglycerate dehydrogenase and related dehydrogenases|uniref:phosphoglycerate dehydrogenase n=1 Tax=Treponema lecithinolyticum TaxID=53418 RepID=UPI00360F90A3
MYKIQTLNKISARGLDLLPRELYEIASEIPNPDAIIVRSADMHNMNISKSVKAVARAGAGTNNIPVADLTSRGIAVFNTPGANANAVKELAIAALIFSSRPIIEATRWVQTLHDKGSDIPDLAEKGKAQFIGPELRGKRLGVIGLGAVGAMVANAAVEMGMHVTGYDPFISVDSAWVLNRDVEKAENLDTLFAKSDYISLHLPQTSETKGLINSERLKNAKKGLRILNFARGGLVVNADMCEAVKDGRVACFVSDFTDEELLHTDGIICLPHLGASTPEAEENCACMAVHQLRSFLEKGTVENSVNFPKCKMEGDVPSGGTRLCIANKNVPNMVGQITTILAEAQQNIYAMINRNRFELAYNIIDVEGLASAQTLERIAAIEGIIGVRAISAADNKEKESASPED